MSCANGAKPKKNIRIKIFYGLVHFQVQKRNVYHFFREGYPVTSQFFIVKSIIIQQTVGDFLFACRNEDNVPSLLHLPDKIFKKMDICRMIDIDNNSHGAGCSSMKTPFCSFSYKRTGNQHSSFSPLNDKK